MHQCTVFGRTFQGLSETARLLSMDSKNRWLIAAALGVLTLGVGFAQANSRILPPPVPAARSYLCFDGATAGEVMRKANEAGARGWKMVAASSHGNRSVWCFEQLNGTRPQSSN